MVYKESDPSSTIAHGVAGFLRAVVEHGTVRNCSVALTAAIRIGAKLSVARRWIPSFLCGESPPETPPPSPLPLAGEGEPETEVPVNRAKISCIAC